jgi:hypothetical protein
MANTDLKLDELWEIAGRQPGEKMLGDLVDRTGHRAILLLAQSVTMPARALTPVNHRITYLSSKHVTNRDTRAASIGKPARKGKRTTFPIGLARAYATDEKGQDHPRRAAAT